MLINSVSTVGQLIELAKGCCLSFDQVAQETRKLLLHNHHIGPQNSGGKLFNKALFTMPNWKGREEVLSLFPSSHTCKVLM